jgi:ABC-type sugar transport system permease subunit/ABC-type glycerol-3-phosphate transport system substrate-binding protein
VQRLIRKTICSHSLASPSRRALACLLVACFVILSCACGHTGEPSGGKPVEVAFWNFFGIGTPPGQAIKKMVEDFNAAHPGIYVKRLDVPLMERKFLTAVAGRVPPDVAIFDRFRVASFAARGGFEPLDEYINRDGIKESDFFVPCWQESKYNGRMYALPFNTDVRVLFYNNKLFREAGLDPNRPPRTWKELIEYADKLTKRDENGRITQVGFVPISSTAGSTLANWGNTWLYLYGWQKGGEYISPDGKTLTPNHPKIVEALQWVADFTKRYGLTDLKAFASGFGIRELQPFLVGQMAMTGDEGYLMSLIRNYNPGLDYSVAPLPYPEDGVRATWSGGYALVIPAGAKHPDAAWQFIKWMTSPKPQAFYAKTAEQMPANARATEDPYFSQDKNWQVFLSEMEYSRYRPVTPVGSQLWDELERATELAVEGRMSSKQALDRAARVVQQELDAFLEKERYPKVNWALVRTFFIALAALVLTAWTLFVRRRLRGMHLLRAEAKRGYMFISPWLIGFGLFVIGPILLSILYSFCHYEVVLPARWAGISNYRELFTQDTLFAKCLSNTLFYTAFSVPLGMAAALGLALLLNRPIKRIAFFRTIFYLPSVVPIVASAVLWMWIFNPNFGILNVLLKKIGLYPILTVIVGEKTLIWLSSTRLAKPALILMSLWTVGPGMVIYLAGLQSIPQHLYEAAQIDGASGLRRFRHITLPMLSPTIFFTMVMGIIGSFQVFTQAFIMTGGGPVDSTLFYVLYLFRNAFEYFKMGYASAMAWILFVIVFILTMIQVKLAPRWVHYEAEVK